MWEWNDILASPRGGDCTERTFPADTAGTKVFCEVADDLTGDYTGRTVTLRIDQTPPTVARPGFDRPPDLNGWFNHPVGFGLLGHDDTSGIASCTGGTYGGPDGAGVLIGGSCRDVAGNAASEVFPLNYDATPPQRPSVEAVPGDERVNLDWSSAAGLESEVVRVPRRGRTVVVYRGRGDEFTDRRLRNRRRYRYVVNLIDQAGNRASDDASAVPTASPLLSPASGARLRRPPKLLWKPVRRARYYNVQLLRAGRKVLSRWPRQEELQVRRRWRFDGRRRRLVPGRYCWYVWPGLGPRSERRYGRLLDKSCFRIVR